MVKHLIIITINAIFISCMIGPMYTLTRNKQEIKGGA